MKAASCPLRPSARPCLTVEQNGSMKSDPDKVECWKTGEWCEKARPLTSFGTRPMIPARYQSQIQIKEQGLLPHSIEAEEAVLGSLILDSPFLLDTGACGVLKPSDFYRERNGLLFASIIALRARGISADQVTLGHELTREKKMDAIGGYAYLSYLVSRVPDPFNCRYYADIVRDCAERRRTIERAGREAGEAYEGKAAKQGFKGFSIES